MNPAAKLRLRRITAWAALAWVVLALGAAISFWMGSARRYGPPLEFSGVATDPWRVTRVDPAAAAAGVEVGDRVLGIDRVPMDRVVLSWSTHFESGRLNLVRVEKPDGMRFDVALRPASWRERASPTAQLLPLGLGLVGLVYVGIGLGVWWMRPDREASWVLLLFCCAMAVNLFSWPRTDGLGWILSWIDLPVLGAATFHLFTSYPIQPAWIVRTRGVYAALYAVAFLLGGLALAESWIGAPPGLFKSLAFAVTVAAALGGFATLARERLRVRRSPVADRADIMLLSALITFVPVLAVAVAQNVLHTALPWHVTLLWVFLFPVAVAYGMMRKQLFEVRSIARSSAAYGAATLAITGVYALLITLTATEASRFHVNARSPWFSVLFLFLAIVLFNPLRNRMQRLVDRIFGRDPVVYGQAVREISDAMVAMLSVKEIVDRILVALTETMGVDRAMVLLRDEETRDLVPVASRGEWEPEALDFRIAADHPFLDRLRAGRGECMRADFDDEADADARDLCRDVFDVLEVELVVPISFAGELLGAIAVGGRLSGERLGPGDCELVRTLANQSSVAIENAKAFDEIAQLNETLEARVEERTHALQEAQSQLTQSEKMRSLGQLVAGIAHELNNPIGFVHANLKLLDEFARKLVAQQQAGEDTTRTREAIEKLLVRSQEGTERVKKIVEDLSVFSRMDHAELEAADLNREIDRTLSLMEPRLKDGIRVERDYEALPSVRCHIGQINQVLMNLLMNSADALGRSGTIRVRTRAVPGGVRVELEDDGPGIPAEIRDRIFEPFFTTKPVGEGTGLGLSLSHGIIERHGGSIRAESAVEGGARFVIELPLDAAPAAS